VLYSLLAPPWRPARTQSFYLTAVSPRYGDLRTGTLLLAFAIERVASEGVEIIDMLRADESCKKVWHLEWTPTRGIALDHNAAHNIEIGGSEMAA